MNNKKFGSLSSSVNPDQLGATVQAIILGLSGVITLLAARYGVQLLPADIQGFAAQAAVWSTQIAVGVSAVGAVFGLIRKAVVKFSAK